MTLKETDLIERKNKPVQQRFEDLLAQYHGAEVVEEDLPVNNNGQVVRQRYFVRPSSSDFPNMGAELVSSTGTLSYFVDYYPSITEVGEPIWVAVNRMDNTGTNRDTNMPGDMIGLHGLMLKYDAGIIQAAANVFNQPILHSQYVDFDQVAVRTELTTRGYTKKRGFPLYFDRVFVPQT